MAYSYKNSKDKTYYLHSRDAKGNTGTKLYFFAGEVKDGSVDAVPEGYEVSETSRGLPVLKKTGGSASSNAKSSSSGGRKSKK